MTKLYEDFNYPSWYRDYLPTTVESERENYWLSQSRPGTDRTQEVLRVTFKKPSSIGQVTLQALRHDCKVELFYVDRRSQRLPLMSKKYIPISRTVVNPDSQIDVEDNSSWVTIKEDIYPVVAKQFEIVVTRTGSGSEAYNIGLKGLEIRRNLYVLDDTKLPISDEVDALGNYVSKTVKNWDPVKAIDSDSFTYWKSSPQPTKDSVVSYYLDVRDQNGAGQIIDRLWMDPTYSGQRMNIYFSTDDTEGTRRLKPVVYPPKASQNVTWKDGVGLHFLPEGVQQYDLKSLSLNPRKAFWVGGSWSPRYSSTDTTATKPSILFQENESNLSFIFNPATSRFYLLGTDSKTGQPTQISTPTVDFLKNSEMVWAFYYIPGDNVVPEDTWGVVVKDKANTFNITIDSQDLNFNVDPTGDFLVDLEGYVTTMIVKQSNFTRDREKWLASQETYLTPDPVIEDDQGRLPSTTLDNALFGGDFRQAELPFGGLDEFFFESKIWSPVWRDWEVRRSFYFFPRPVFAKYLKVEFTRLTEEPYPVYEEGIEVKYKVFPITLTKDTQRTTTEVWSVVEHYDRLGNKIGYETQKSKTVDIIQKYALNIANGKVMGVPKAVSMPIEMNFRSEGTPFYDMMRATQVRTNTGKNVSSSVELTNYKKTPTWFQGFTTSYGLDWDRLLKDNPKLFGQKPYIGNNNKVNLPMIPEPVNGRYQLPGGMVSVPAAYNSLITTKYSLKTRKLMTFTQERFNTNSVHRYDLKTVTRTEQTGFFAGLREIKAFRVNYRAATDHTSYYVERYNPDDFEVFENIEFFPETGASTIKYWDNLPGAAKYPKTAKSIPLTELGVFKLKTGEEIYFECWVKADKANSTITIPIQTVTGEDVATSWTRVLGTAASGKNPVNDYKIPTSWTRVVAKATVARGGMARVGNATINSGTVTDASVSLTGVSVTKSSSTQENLVPNGELTDQLEGWGGSPTYVTTGLPKVGPGILETRTFESMSFWQRLQFTSIARHPHEVFEDKLDYTPLDDDDVIGASWADPKADWIDKRVPWDADYPFVGIVVSLPTLFSGKTSIKITRPAGYGVAGIKTEPFAVGSNERVRVRAELYKIKTSKNDVVLQLFDLDSGKVIAQNKVETSTGRWTQVYTDFLIPHTSYTNVVARFVIRGEEDEEVYIAGFVPEVTTVVYEASNNGGSTWFDITNVVNREAYYMFPSPGRELKVRVTMTGNYDHFFGFEATPTYQRSIKE